MKTVEEILKIEVATFVDEENGFNYLPWATAWEEFLKICPNATYDIKKREDGVPVFGNMELGYMVFTSVTAEGITRPMHLPVMNRSFNVIKNPNMFDINSSIMRCLVKNIAMFGLGLDVYIGDDKPKEKKQDKGLVSYDSKNLDIEVIEDPLDAPVSEPVEVKKAPVKIAKKAPKIEPKKSKIDDAFTLKVNSDSEYTEEKKQEILNNNKIPELLKESYINGSFRF